MDGPDPVRPDTGMQQPVPGGQAQVQVRPLTGVMKPLLRWKPVRDLKAHFITVGTDTGTDQRGGLVGACLPAFKEMCKDVCHEAAPSRMNDTDFIQSLQQNRYTVGGEYSQQNAGSPADQGITVDAIFETTIFHQMDGSAMHLIEPGGLREFQQIAAGTDLLGAVGFGVDQRGGHHSVSHGIVDDGIKLFGSFRCIHVSIIPAVCRVF